jgi:hypothetical protein
MRLAHARRSIIDPHGLPSQAAEEVVYFAIPSEARNLSSI